MFLKVLTTGLVLLGVGLMIAFPFLLGARPGPQEKLELARYGSRLLTYFLLTCSVWIGAAACAIVMVRRTKREFMTTQRENLRELVEGSTSDHGRK